MSRHLVQIYIDVDLPSATRSEEAAEFVKNRLLENVTPYADEVREIRAEAIKFGIRTHSIYELVSLGQIADDNNFTDWYERHSN